MILQKCSLWKVAEIFFLEPTKTHYIKEISRNISLAHTSIIKHLSTLLELGLIVKSKSDIYNGYKSNREIPEFVFHKKISNLIFLNNSGLTQALKEHYPKAIILYGSYDKGEDIESSDIDIYVDSKKFNINPEKYEKYLGRNIHLLFKEEASKSLMESIKQGTIIFGER
ncbi:MAG: nucleotidyltransferase domain-containing protein [Candidatus Nanoarchaeia archaeon]|nr:nucleotidyltransferase domain-containing protein [Candidatus Nanoarchaeia archaeon]MDD5740525.1 nucleotidyltransferase domain-containing protein [Candidatus Nanoarchaeia archaeon]